jgi:hypothetical protein
MPTKSLLSTYFFSKSANASLPSGNQTPTAAPSGLPPGLQPVIQSGSKAAARRKISAIDGRALEILGHAIEYLADEYALSCAQIGKLSAADPRVEAIQMLMAVNRQVYYACPVAEPVSRRIARALGIPSASH